ncbi:tRNA(Ile)-lysidine synthase [Alloiococcus otitis]|uniref:tRNA(Ile)-lysidine synthase n=1 Tax=Alloiococcus otitis ATCC 51267 TaxID=883081 RepID=K9E6W9_9LACT|nr:tRNA lysidine(34) synthetase TilS [Alloiococcus otitis]EKU92884.1 tRNA(Ile)-lysidine synthetase [Alloiococcus otitis ATCC 51267]SUU80501.1 tRNA(Ile)-lysidine synthase [Alloiococcus otitis]
MNLIESIENNIVKNHLWTKDDSLLLAVSGGVDSVVLLYALGELADRFQPAKIGVAHVNHMTRPGTQAEEAGVRQMANSFNYPVYVKRWQDKPGKGNFEDQARTFRYKFFRQVMESEGYSHLLTAHHLDDQAETILMKLVRGGLLEDKQGILMKRKWADFDLVRPLLETSKAEIYRYAQDRGLTYFEDESNQRPSYLRNRLRQRVLPQLKQENDQALTHLAEFAKDLRDLTQLAQETLDRVKADLVDDTEEGDVTFSIPAFLDLQPALQRFLLQDLLKEVFHQSKSFKKDYIDLILNWLREGKVNSSLDLARPWQVYKTYDQFYLRRVGQEKTQSGSKKGQGQTYYLTLNQWIQVSPNEKIGFFEAYHPAIEKGDLALAIPKTSLQLPILARHRKAGDKMTYRGGEGHKKIKDIFINQKAPSLDRDQAWLLEDARGQILWLIGYQGCQLSNDAITDKINYIFVYKQIPTEG